MKNILLISNMYPSKSDESYGIFVKNTEDILKELGYKVVHSVIKRNPVLKWKICQYICCYGKAIILSMIYPVDAVYIHFISHTWWPVKWIKRIRPRAIILGNGHGEDIVPDGEKFLKNKVRTKRALELIDYMLVPSAYFRKYLAGVYQFPKECTFIFPSGGVDERIFFPRDQKECRVRLSKLGKIKNRKGKACDQIQRKYPVMESEKRYVGFASRFVAGKGWEVFLEAVRKLEQLQETESFRYIMIGEGDEEHSLLEKIKELKHKERVQICPMMSQRELGLFFNCLDVFCFPTTRKSESLGLVGIEAMRCGTVCVISDAVNGPHEYAKNGKNALLFQSDNADDLADRIIDALYMTEKQRLIIREAAIETGKVYSRQCAQRVMKGIMEQIK